jgi:hypothetical protein
MGWFFESMHNGREEDVKPLFDFICSHLSKGQVLDILDEL